MSLIATRDCAYASRISGGYTLFDEKEFSECHDELKRIVAVCTSEDVAASRAAFDELAEFVVENHQVILEALDNQRRQRR